MQAIH